MGTIVDVPPDVRIAQQVIAESEPVITSQSPTNWWTYGLIGLGIVVAVLLVLQLLMGAPGSDVQSGTPVAAPVTQTSAQ